jgi:pimeloyl-ACP methyl ester carboxylesterase
MTQQRPPSVYREALAWTELTQLFATPVYYGSGVTRGDGRLVLVLPGLFGNDFYLLPMHSWLARVGYRPVGSTLALNVGCPERLRKRVDEELQRAAKQTEGPVALVGHSRGGILARAMAADLGDRCSHLILLGSPVGGLENFAKAMGTPPVARRTVRAGTRWRKLLDPDCDVPLCGCPFPADFQRPLSGQTRVTSIYSRDDSIVPAAACPIQGAKNIEVRGTHIGLVYNSAVYKHVANALGER